MCKVSEGYYFSIDQIFKEELYIHQFIILFLVMEENLNKDIYSIPGFTISSYLFLGSILQFTACRLYDDITIKSSLYLQADKRNNYKQ